MFKSKIRLLSLNWVVFLIIIVHWPVTTIHALTEPLEHYGIGTPATERDIQAWNIDVAPDGTGLPSGQGTVAEGATIYRDACASCHGPNGIEGPMPRLVGGLNTLHTDRPVKTIGSYWPFATTVFDYIYRAMPLTSPQSLTPSEVYAVVAWLLFRNGIIKESTILDAQSLPSIQMPNHDSFSPDPRPDVLKAHP